MPKETLTTRVTRLEESTQALIDSQIRTDARIAELREESNARIVELRDESNEREKRMDKRIADLVSAIAEFLRRNGK